MKRSKALSLAVAVLTVVLCAALCASVLALYGNGLNRRAEAGSSTAPVFTREAVGQQLKWVCPALGIWLAAVIAAGSSGCLPGREKTAQPTDRALSLLRACVGNPPPEAERERAKRRRIRFFCLAVLLLCMGWGLAWLLNGNNFLSWDLERVMGELLLHILPPLLLGFAALLLAGRLSDESRIREINVLRETVRERPSPAVRVPLKDVPETGKRRWTRGALYVLASVLLVLGVLNGGLNDVLVKAINICTECIGLG